MNLSYINIWYLFAAVITTVYLVLLMDKNNDDQNISGLPPKKFVKFVLMMSILIGLVDFKNTYSLPIWIVFIYLFNLIHENKKITKTKVITTLTIVYASIIWFIFFTKKNSKNDGSLYLD
jgi:hypothetical protein